MAELRDIDDSKCDFAALKEEETLDANTELLAGNSEPVIKTRLNEDGTTSSYFDKRKLKIAPRSTLQFKVGPPFEFFGSYHSVTEIDSSELLKLQIIPRIDRGFDYIEDEWVGYKRNYFTLVSTFQTPGWELQEYLNSSFQLNLDFGCNTKSFKIKYFAIKIKARSDEDYSEITLVQHTAKRDKGPQFIPATCPLIPSALPKHQVIREASNVRNTNKMKKYDSTFFFHRDQEDSSKYSARSLLNSYPEDSIQKVARYERVQFASSINVKKPTQQNRHFRLHVILGAVINYNDDLKVICNDSSLGLSVSDEIVLLDGSKDGFIPLQEVRTPPLIIRGRSPSNYTSSQRVCAENKSSCASTAEAKEIDLFATISPSLRSPPLLSSQEENDAFSTPMKPRSFRSLKRRQKTNENTSKAVRKPDIDNVILRKNKRVETLEQIEKKIHEQLPLCLRSSNDENKSRMECNSSGRPNMSRHNSIDPREIELKPTTVIKNSYCAAEDDEYFEEENTFTAGSLALTATLKSQNSKLYKRRRINQSGLLESFEMNSRIKPNLSSSQISRCNSPKRSNSVIPNDSEGRNDSTDDHRYQEGDSCSYESYDDDFNCISLSILEESSSHYCHMTNLDSVHSEIEAMPRAFTRIIRENSFTNLFLQMETASQAEETVPAKHNDLDLLSAIGSLPSQMMGIEEFYDELYLESN